MAKKTKKKKDESQPNSEATESKKAKNSKKSGKAASDKKNNSNKKQNGADTGKQSKKVAKGKGSKNSKGAKNSKGSKDKKKTDKQYSWEDSGSTERGLLVIFLFGLAAVSFLSFINAAGDVGIWVDAFLGWIFGWGRYVTPAIFAVLGYIFLHPEKYKIRFSGWFGLAIFVLSLMALLHLFVPYAEFVTAPKDGRGGGYLALLFGYPLVEYGGIWVSIVVLLGLFVASWLIMFRMSLKDFIKQVKSAGPVGGAVRWARSRAHAMNNGYSISRGGDNEEEDEDDDEEYHQDQLVETVAEGPQEETANKTAEEAPQGDADHGFTQRDVAQAEYAAASAEQMEQTDLVPKEEPKKKKRLKIDVPLELLTDKTEKPTSGDIEANKEKIQKAFDSFKIDVEMGEVSVGPMVSQYTLKPSDGVKLTQITTLHNDIALALAAHPIRIEAPIPGKSLVGIEVPNKARAVVTLREVLVSKQFKKRKDNLTLSLGRDVAGKSYVASLAKMPHLLIAGATGAGKSVCMNGIIASLIYQNSPDDLKFIMVDPKRVELSVYNGIPHLLTPVITDVEKTVNALKWAVTEMDRRYEVLARAGKRSIESYNSSVSEEDKMPYIVFMIDELADLMSVAAQSVEAAIVRLAQMSRAVGIHLVLATQRPSVNVITGLIKANMPARIAFSVTSLTDSRTILDFSGAEKLLGRGDMLYIDSQLSKPKRVQGAFLGDDEIENIVSYLKEKAGDTDYNNDVTDSQSAKGVPGMSGGSGGDSDDLLPQAKEVILEAGKASASMLQRRLRVGYARAARILDILEAEGFIGPADGAKPRAVLATEVDTGEDPDEALANNPDMRVEYDDPEEEAAAQASESAATAEEMNDDEDSMDDAAEADEDDTSVVEPDIPAEAVVEEKEMEQQSEEKQDDDESDTEPEEVNDSSRPPLGDW